MHLRQPKKKVAFPWERGPRGGGTEWVDSEWRRGGIVMTLWLGTALQWQWLLTTLCFL
jgi:hypothetical protein